jgi:hypothetical protein
MCDSTLVTSRLCFYNPHNTVGIAGRGIGVKKGQCRKSVTLILQPKPGYPSNGVCIRLIVIFLISQEH